MQARAGLLALIGVYVYALCACVCACAAVVTDVSMQQALACVKGLARARVVACVFVCLCTFACHSVRVRTRKRTIVSLCVFMIRICTYIILYIHICAYTYAHRDGACNMCLIHWQVRTPADLQL